MVIDIIFGIGLLITAFLNIYNYILYIASGKFSPFEDIEDYGIDDWLLIFLGSFVVLFAAVLWPVELMFLGFKKIVIYVKYKIEKKREKRKIMSRYQKSLKKLKRR